MNTKLHALTDANGRPLSFFITAGQISDYTGAAVLLDDLPKAQWMLADRGYNADWFRDTLQQKGIKPCIPGRKSRSLPVKYDKRRYKRRNRIEIMFGRLKDWRRVATRYDRCPTVFFSALALAATVMIVADHGQDHDQLTIANTNVIEITYQLARQNAQISAIMASAARSSETLRNSLARCARDISPGPQMIAG